MKYFSILIISIALLIGKTLNSSNKKEYIPKVNIQSIKQINEEIALVDTNKVFPAIMVKDGEKSSPISLNSLKIKAEIIGNTSFVTYDMTFYNAEDRVLEGELYFPLDEGQSVSHFELDVNGKLRKGVIVEKEKGRVAFEATIRQKVDPGLVEWTKGNNFKTRIYPIPAKGYKRVIIGFNQELQNTDQGAVFQLPMNFETVVKEFSFTAEVIEQTNQPVVPNGTMNLTFNNWEHNYKTKLEKKNYIPNESIRFFIPFIENGAKLWRTKTDNTNEYAYYGVVSTFVNKNITATPLQNVCIIYDASHSGRNKDISKEIDFLDALFKQNYNAKVTLYLLRNDFKIEVNKSNWNTVKNQITKTVFDGATQFGSIQNLAKYDAVLLLTDGLQTIGKETPNFGKNKVFTINTKKEANHGFLRNIARNHNGKYINLLNTSISDGMQAINDGNTSLVLHLDAKNKYETIRSYMKNNQRYFTFSFLSDQAINSIRYTIDKYDNIATTKTIEASVVQSDFITKIAVQRIVEDWSILKSKENELLKIGKKYKIVTPFTSLIVLDRIEDYVTHKIEPPTELKPEWNKLMAEQNKLDEAIKNSHMEDVISDFETKIAWYNTKFEWRIIENKDKKKAKTSIQHDLRRRSVSQSASNLDEYEIDDVAYEEDMEVESLSAPLADGILSEDANSNKKKEKKLQKGKRISIESWNPDTPYMKSLKKGEKKTAYTTYLSLKKDYQKQPSFFLDVADYFFEIDEKELGLRILTNISEMELENHQLLRIIAHKLEQLEYYDLAYSIYLEVEKIRGEEPQSYRDLGLVCEKMGKYQEAIDYLNYVVTTKWDGRFPKVETITASEINKIIASHPNLDLSAINKKLIKNMPMDMRVVVDWDADNCDIDLWVTDPRGEKCFYSNKNTKIGGLMSYDFTGGYGPEEFNIKTGMPGEYKIEVNYFGSSQQTIAGPTTIMIKVYTNYGKSNQEVQEITRRVSTTKEVLAIGNIKI